MATYSVKFEQWVQETAEVEIEAGSAEEAFKIAHERERDGDLDLDWSDGSDIKDCEIKAVWRGNTQDYLDTARILELYDEL